MKEKREVELTSVVEDVSGASCAQRESALAVVTWVLVEEGQAIRACAASSSERSRMVSQFVQLGAGPKMYEVCACEEKTGTKSKAMREASPMILDAKNRSGEEKAVWGAAVRHV